MTLKSMLLAEIQSVACFGYCYLLLSSPVIVSGQSSLTKGCVADAHRLFSHLLGGTEYPSST